MGGKLKRREGPDGKVIKDPALLAALDALIESQALGTHIKRRVAEITGVCSSGGDERQIRNPIISRRAYCPKFICVLRAKDCRGTRPLRSTSNRICKIKSE